MNRVAVTGVGVLTCLGRGLSRHAEALVQQPCALGPIALFAAPQLAGSPVGQVPAAALEGAPDDAARVVQLGWCAARDALGDFSPSTPGVIVVGTTTGSIYESEQAFARAFGVPGAEPARRMRHHPMGEVAFQLASRLKVSSECHTFATACSSSSNAIGYGALRVRQGAPWALVGGVDSLCLMTYAGFNALRLLSRGVPRPFDAKRSGVAVAEGAAFLLLEPLELAEARGAKVFGEVIGWGCAVDAYHQTAPDPTGVGMVAAMRGAIDEAGLTLDAVGYINAHGTATDANDRVEALAINALFGAVARPWVSSTKGLTGHTLGAAGAVEAALCLALLETHRAPPTTGLQSPDPACELAHVPTSGVTFAGSAVLSNSFGFGGNNACLAFQARGAAPLPPRTRPIQPVAFVHGMGVFAAGIANCRDLAAALPHAPIASPWSDVAGDRATSRTSRMSGLERMALEAAREALGANPAEGTALVIGTAYGSLQAATGFLEGLARRGIEHGSPLAFYQSVYHAVAGQLGIQLGLKGIGMTTSARELSGESALQVALGLLTDGRAERVLVVAADDAPPALGDLLPPEHPTRLNAPCGAGALLLSREPSLLCVRGCAWANHPVADGALASPAQTQALLAQAMASGALGLSCLGEELLPGVTRIDDHRRFGLNASGGLLRIVAALLRLQAEPGPRRALIHGLALGGGQALTTVERLADP